MKRDLPPELYSRGQQSLQLGKFGQASIDAVALFVWVLLPIALWGALGLLAWALFFA